jgi:hypothetical protein
MYVQLAINEAAGTGAPTEGGGRGGSGGTGTLAAAAHPPQPARPEARPQLERPVERMAPRCWLATCHRIGSRLGRRGAPDARDGDRRASASGDAAAAAGRVPNPSLSHVLVS